MQYKRILARSIACFIFVLLFSFVGVRPAAATARVSVNLPQLSLRLQEIETRLNSQFQRLCANWLTGTFSFCPARQVRIIVGGTPTNGGAVGSSGQGNTNQPGAGSSGGTSSDSSSGTTQNGTGGTSDNTGSGNSTPPPSGKVLISEVYADVAAAHGAETENEWVEIYNGTNTSLNLTGWSIGGPADNLFDRVPTTTTSIVGPGKFAVITAATSTPSYWPTLPSATPIIILGQAIGNGLSNSGDAVFLKNPAGDIVDAVSYGSKTDAFSPAPTAPAEGKSLYRTTLSQDTNTSADWDSHEPNPGA